MISREILPRKGCMLSCKVVENYDALDVISSVFNKTPISKLRDNFWRMYKWALLDETNFPEKDDLCTLTFVYECVDEAIIGLYSIAVQKGLLPLPQSQSNLSAIEHIDAVSKPGLNRMTAYEPFETLSELWKMFQSAICEGSQGQTDKEIRTLISTFEIVSDLAAAAYVLINEPEEDDDNEQDGDEDEDE